MNTRSKGPQKIFIARDTRRFVKEWTESLLLQARYSADAGDFSLMGDVYDGLLQADAHHPGTLNAVAENALSMCIKYNQDENHDEETDVEEATEHDFRELAREELVKMLAQGLSLGFCWVQLLPWQPNEDGRLVPTIKVWPIQAIRYNGERRVWQALTQSNEAQDLETKTGLWALFAPYGEDRPWLSGTWRACAPWCKSKIDARLDWDRQGETAAGIKSVETPEGANNNDRREAARDLSNVGTDGVFVPPPGWKMDLHQASTSTYQTFKEKIDAADRQISIANKGESFTSGEGGGGLAEGAGKTRKEVSDKRAEFLAEQLCKFLNEQILPIYTRANFGEQPIARACLDNEDPEDLQELSQTWQQAGQAAATFAGLGVQIDYVALAKKIKMPLLVQPGATPKPKPDLAPSVPAKGATAPAPTIPAAAE
jgi:hypothetical protein